MSNYQEAESAPVIHRTYRFPMLDFAHMLGLEHDEWIEDIVVNPHTGTSRENVVVIHTTKVFRK